MILPPAAPRPAPATPRQPWHWRARELVGAYLPLLLMALLALATWWLVRNTPVSEERVDAPVFAGEPDYTMHGVLLQRFAADGTLRLQVEGDVLRHYPANETIEIDQVRLRAIDPRGALLLASARQALTNDAATEVQLRGGAQVRHAPADGGAPAEFRGEFLHAFVETQVLRSDQPVTLTQGRNEIRAAGMVVDQRARTARLDGPVRATLDPLRRRP